VRAWARPTSARAIGVMATNMTTAIPTTASNKGVA
jgi:hypothetical protein